MHEDKYTAHLMQTPEKKSFIFEHKKNATSVVEICVWKDSRPLAADETADSVPYLVAWRTTIAEDDLQEYQRKWQNHGGKAGKG